MYILYVHAYLLSVVTPKCVITMPVLMKIPPKSTKRQLLRRDAEVSHTFCLLKI